MIDKAIELGITLFDTADVYGKRGGSETMIGQILGDRRKDIVLATKFGMAMDEAETLKGRVAAVHFFGGGSEPATAAKPIGSIFTSCTKWIR